MDVNKILESLMSNNDGFRVFDYNCSLHEEQQMGFELTVHTIYYLGKSIFIAHASNLLISFLPNEVVFFDSRFLNPMFTLFLANFIAAHSAD